MLKALMKRQFLELSASVFQNRKTGKKRSRGGIVGYAIFFAAIFFLLGFVFYQVAAAMASAMVEADLAWLYFAIMGLVAIALGVFGSVFNTYSGLYLAKDNELLLSMPIPVEKILLTRLLGIYVMGVLYETIVLLPTLLAYWSVARTSARSITFGILMIPVMGVLILTLTCALGYVVARLSTRFRNKSYITVLLSLALIALYYFLYFRFSTMLQGLLLDSSGAEKLIRTWLYPAYLMGRASCGDVLSMVFYTVGISVLFVLCYAILRHSFLQIATGNRGERKAVYREKETKVSPVRRALFRREWQRFTSSAAYMLNCGLGTVLMPIAAVAVLLKREMLRDVLAQLVSELPNAAEFVPIGIVMMVCMLITMNDVTAPSISLEGENIWIMQSVPVDPWDALRAKLDLQYALTLIQAISITLALCWVAEVHGGIVGWILVLSIVFMQILAKLGLMLNLKKPNLHWTNETLVVKQSAAVLIVIFGGWAVTMVMGGGFYLLRNLVGCNEYLVGWIVVFLLLNRGMETWLRKKGTERFANL